MFRTIGTTFALTVTVAAASPTPETSTHGTLTGRVVGSDTQEGIAYVSISILGAQRGGQTDRDGRFSITHVPPGTYEIRLKMVEYLTLSRQVTVHPGKQSLGTFRLKPAVSPIPVVGTSAKPDSGELSCEVGPVNDQIFVGDQLRLKLVIHNHGPKDVVLPYGLAGSDDKRYPRIRVRVEGPDHGFSRDGYVSCCPDDPIVEGDLATVPSGRNIDVFSRGWMPSNILVGSFKKSGAYTAIVSYSTRQPDARKWIGSTAYSAVPPQIVKRLRRIPLVDLVDSVNFEVQPQRRANKK